MPMRSARYALFRREPDLVLSRCRPERCAAYHTRCCNSETVPPSSAGEATGTITR